jgi:hypothetical protein
MGLPQLDNLVRIRQLKAEPRAQSELDLDSPVSRALLVLPQSPPHSSRDARFHGDDS